MARRTLYAGQLTLDFAAAAAALAVDSDAMTSN